jgi:DNA-binding NarL/FixJ family response regulator
MDGTMIRVMVVAKHAEVREGLCAVLRLESTLEVTRAAESLDSAVHLAGVEYPDVVLVDLEMPEGEGYETIRQLKRLCPGTKTIALTAHDYPAVQESAIRAGANRMMVKGLDLSDMVAVIQTACSHS